MGNVTTKEKKKAGQNWGKPNTWQQRFGARRFRKWVKKAIRKILESYGEKE